MAQKRRSPEIIAGRSGGAAPATGPGTGGWTVTRTAVGVYAITFEPSFRLLNFVCSISGANQATTAYALTAATSGNTVTVYASLTGTGAVDVGFDFIAVGVQQ